MFKVKDWKKVKSGVQFIHCPSIVPGVENVMRISDGEFFSWMDDVMDSTDFTTWAIDSFSQDGIHVNLVNIDDETPPNENGIYKVVTQTVPINHVEKIIIDSPSD